MFKDIAVRGKSTIISASSMQGFYGFKLHLVVCDRGEIIDFQITQANVDDRTPLKGNLLEKIWGRPCAISASSMQGDKGYIGKFISASSMQVCGALFEKGIYFATGVKKNMKTWCQCRCTTR